MAESEGTRFTEDDIRAALWAKDIDVEFAVQYDHGMSPYRRANDPRTAEETVRALCYTYDYNYLGPDEDPQGLTERQYQTWFEKNVVTRELERYRRGKAVRSEAKIITSYRFTTGESGHAEERMTEGETLLSPIIRVSSGHIATMEAHHYVALAVRKGDTKED
jgi:hypothetical protein